MVLSFNLADTSLMWFLKDAFPSNMTPRNRALVSCSIGCSLNVSFGICLGMRCLVVMSSLVFAAFVLLPRCLMNFSMHLSVAWMFLCTRTMRFPALSDLMSSENCVTSAGLLRFL